MAYGTESLCWFCKNREGTPGLGREVKLFRRSGSSVKRTTTSVPRCSTCKAGHSRVRKMGFSIGLGACGIVILVLCLWRPIDIPVWLRVVLAILAFGAGGTLIGGRFGLPPGIEPETALASHPDIMAARREGWTVDEAVLK